MDTDDLSEDVYEAVFVESDKFHTDLTLQFGLLAEDCTDEDDFLDSCMRRIFEIKKLNQSDLSDIFFDDVPTKSEVAAALNRIVAKIKKFARVPPNKRKLS